jgi:PAS domain S-box-containing protein
VEQALVFKFTTISIAIFIAAVVNVFVTHASWQRRRSTGGIFFTFAAQTLTIWTLAAALDYAAVPLSLKVFFAKLEVLGYCSAIALMTAFSITYAGNEKWLKNPWINFSLIIVPLSSILLAWTNELHHWFWTGYQYSALTDNVLIYEHGPAFTWVTFSGYGFLLVTLVNLVQASFSGSTLSRRQARLLLLALIVPIASNALYLSNATHTPGVDWSSITFSITGLLFLWALYGSRFLDIVPVARNTIIDSMADGVLVLDNLGNLVDFNPAAQIIFGIRQEALWTPIGTALKNWPEVSALLENPATPEATEVTFGEPTRVFDLRLTSLTDTNNRVYGFLIVMRDVTDRKKTEARLLQAREQINDQQRELAVIETRRHMAHTLHDSVNQSIHSMVLFSETLTALLEKGTLDKVPYMANRLQESARQALKETRLLLYELQPLLPDEDVNLLRDLETRLATVERHAGVGTQLTLKGSMEYCPQQWQVGLYWIATEALNNAIKHAQARSVKIIIHSLPDRIELEVVDDGRGFEPANAPVGGFGLRNMRERASFLGGELTIASASGRGTRVHFRTNIKGVKDG